MPDTSGELSVDFLCSAEIGESAALFTGVGATADDRRVVRDRWFDCRWFALSLPLPESCNENEEGNGGQDEGKQGCKKVIGGIVWLKPWPATSDNDPVSDERAFKHLLWRLGAQLEHFRFDFAQTHLLQTPLLLHEQHFGGISQAAAGIVEVYA